MQHPQLANHNPDRDVAAVAELFDEHAEGLRLFAATFSGDPSTADDAVQQAFFSLLRRGLSRVRDRKRYLYRAVRNAMLNISRSETRERRRREALTYRSAPFFSEPHERREELDALNGAVAGLGHDQRQVVVLKVWGQLTFAEIGDVIGISPNTAASRYRYAIGHPRQAMEELL